MEYELLSQKDFKVSIWSGGKTTEIAIYPPNSDYGKRDFLWRLSSATVESETSHFTLLPLYNRFISVLKGDILLWHDEFSPKKNLKPYEVYEFDGAFKHFPKASVRILISWSEKEKPKAKWILLTYQLMNKKFYLKGIV